MALTFAQITALTTELNTDPKALGYAARIAAGDDTGVAAILNSVEPTPETGPVASVKTEAIFEAIAIADWNTLTTAGQNYILGLLQIQTVNPGNTQIVAALGNLFAGKATLTRLQALATRNYTRAEILFGAGVTVDALDVARAQGRGLQASH